MIIPGSTALQTMLLSGNNTDSRLTTLLIIGIALIALVFIVQLIIISRLLSRNKEASGRDNANSYVDNVIAGINEQEEAELTDNSELLAAITAAIHAYRQDIAIETPADGFIVRSIKRMDSRRR